MNPKEEFMQQQMARGVTRQQAAIMWQEHIGNAQPISGTDSVPLQESLEAAVRATVEGPATLAGRAASTDPGMLALGGAPTQDPAEFSAAYLSRKAAYIETGVSETQAREYALRDMMKDRVGYAPQASVVPRDILAPDPNEPPTSLPRRQRDRIEDQDYIRR